VQIEKLAAGVGHAADIGHAFLEAGFVASKVVAHQLAISGTEQVASISTARLGLKLYSGLSNSRRESCTRNGQAGSGKDFLVTVERQVVSELRCHDVSEQACRGSSLVDHPGR
jgi:hypothetical protein